MVVVLLHVPNLRFFFDAVARLEVLITRHAVDFIDCESLLSVLGFDHDLFGLQRLQGVTEMVGTICLVIDGAGDFQTPSGGTASVHHHFDNADANAVVFLRNGAEDEAGEQRSLGGRSQLLFVALICHLTRSPRFIQLLQRPGFVVSGSSTVVAHDPKVVRKGSDLAFEGVGSVSHRDTRSDGIVLLLRDGVDAVFQHVEVPTHATVLHLDPCDCDGRFLVALS